jgi:hypothetical protein
MVARELDGCGVLASGIITSHMTSAPSLRVVSGKIATGFNTQSELLPSACRVELPSKPQLGRSASFGKLANSLICVLLRRLASGW